jgi:hypothetical protein
MSINPAYQAACSLLSPSCFVTARERRRQARKDRLVLFHFRGMLAVGDVPQYDLFPYGTEQDGSLLKTGTH